MRAFMVIGFSLATAGLMLAADGNDPTTGKWIVESLIRDGKIDDSLKGAVRSHTGDQYTVTPASGTSGTAVSGTYTIDAGKSPVTIDMKPSAGRYKGKTLQGIARLEGDTLTVCFAEPGKERPTKFESTPGSGLVLAVHKRAK